MANNCFELAFANSYDERAYFVIASCVCFATARGISCFAFLVSRTASHYRIRISLRLRFPSEAISPKSETFNFLIYHDTIVTERSVLNKIFHQYNAISSHIYQERFKFNLEMMNKSIIKNNIQTFSRQNLRGYY